VTGERDLERMLATLRPVARPGEFVVVTVADATGLSTHATVREPEGLSCVLARADADAAGLHYDFVGAWITLEVHSALDAVGLTAAVSTALADARISCNVIAGHHHDHLLVPHARVDDALAALVALSDRHRR